jgi:CRP/FNR family transcriptional regulator
MNWAQTSNHKRPMKATLIPQNFIEQHRNEIREINLAPHHIAHEMNTPCLNLLVVNQGSLRVYKRSLDGRMITLYRINAGECCSLSVACILSDSEFPAVMETEDAVTGYIIPAHYVRQWLHDNASWQSFIFQQLARRVTDLTELTDNLAFSNMNSRVANLLSRRSIHKMVHATHQCIADEVGTSREVVSRSLRELEAKGFIKLARGHIKIANFEGLKNFSAV